MTDAEDLDPAAHVQHLARRLHVLEQAGTSSADLEGLARVLETIHDGIEETRKEQKALAARVNSLARHLVSIGQKVGYDFPKPTAGETPTPEGT